MLANMFRCHISVINVITSDPKYLCNHRILTVALLTDFVKDAEKFWCYWGQRIQLHFLEIFWTVFLEMPITLAQAAHDHV